ncbi:MAG: 3-dehydroquinate dehydratase [Chitinophagales bacterium]|jgi:3-dehydroquinate dehydratase-2|nr:3-dehydroquinate dehydratase [Chitinophagales bacterium]
MQQVVHIVNGPNLNLVGQREPSIYGHESFSDLLESLKQEFPTVVLEYYQSNVEGELINYLQGVEADSLGIIINGGGYSHTSVALADTIAASKVPVVAVHLSNTLAREAYRHTDLLAGKAKGYIGGFGMHSYRLALRYLLDLV